MRRVCLVSLSMALAMSACEDASETSVESVAGADAAEELVLSDAALENLVERSYQYVTMFNVNNKFALSQGGWNRCVADTKLKDHTLRDIARPNNDTLYTSCMLDLTQDAMVIQIPAFDSEYVSLMITGYDHYVNVPLSSRREEFEEPRTMLIYSARTPGYDGGPIDGIDTAFEATGDFVSAVFRVMPHAADPERFARIVEQKRAVAVVPLSEFLGGSAPPYEKPDPPKVGETDLDVFENNWLEVMQYVFDHTTFDPENEMDREVLAAWAPLGVAPGQTFDPDQAGPIDGGRARTAADEVRKRWLAKLSDPAVTAAIQPRMFQPKGRTDLEAVLLVSIIGPIGLPREEAIYPQILSADGEPVNAMHDYVVRMSKDDLPPAGAFWSLTLYDQEEGFFIPNDRKKYSVGENGGMQLDEDGGIEIYIAAEKPEGVPEDNWLPIERKDLDLSLQLRLYEPDLEAYAKWELPKAEKL